MKFHQGLVAIVPALTLTANGQSNQSLEPFALEPLPLGRIKPTGWLRDQLVLSGDGLAGHEDEFVRYVKESAWLGGDQDYSGLKEGFPYWFNAIVPLAYGLDDDTLKEKARKSADYVLSHRQDDGWIGPENGKDRNVWGRVPVILGLVGMAEADPDYESQVEDALYAFSKCLNGMLNNDFEGYHYHEGDTVDQFDTTWGQVRFPDLLISFQWLIANHPREQADIDMIYDNMNLLVQGGMDWATWFSEPTFIKEDLNTIATDIDTDDWRFPFVHNVNMAQGLKGTSVIWRFTHNETLPENARNGVDLSFQYHSAPSGSILGDERLAGLSPYYGAELCGVVEEMFSLTTLRNILGDASFADRAELVAFNALPAMLTDDHWAHQYVSQPNQPFSHELEDQTPFWNVNKWGQTFGLEPNFPCCTANHPQGFPKFLAATYTKAGKNGIAHSLLAPASASVSLGDSTVDIECDTNYPFDNTLSYSITADKAFKFHVRLPEWASADDSTITLSSSSKNNKRSEESVSLEPNAQTGLIPIHIPKGQSTMTYTLKPSSNGQITVSTRANDTVSIYAGSVLYALSIDSTNSSTDPKYYDTQETMPAGSFPPESRDWEFDNATAWAVAIDPSTLSFHAGDTSAQLANPLFAPGALPSYMEVQGCEIEWPLFRAVPDNPIPKSQRECQTEAKTYRLVSYGSAKIHMSQLPTIGLAQTHDS